MNAETYINNHTEFVVAYHPKCPHCHTMVDDFKKLAKIVKDKKLELELVAINMSKTDGDAAGIEGVPTVKLIKKDGKIENYEDHRKMDAF